MKRTKIVRRLQLFVLICATVCFAVALVFPDLACQDTLIDVSIVMLLAVQLLVYRVEKREEKDRSEANEPESK